MTTLTSNISLSNPLRPSSPYESNTNSSSLSSSKLFPSISANPTNSLNSLPSKQIHLISTSDSSQLFNDLSSLSSLSSFSSLYSLLSECYDPLNSNGAIYDHIADLLAIQDPSSHHSITETSQNTLQHPYGTLNSASIIDFRLNSSTIDQKKDPFFDLLLSTYGNTKRDIKNKNKNKVTLVLVSGLTETYEFSEIKVYWRFISAICKSHSNNESKISFRGKCLITNSEFFKDNRDIDTFLQVSQGKLEVRPSLVNGNTLQPHSFNLVTDIRAIGLHSDYTMPHPLELQFSSFSCTLHDMEGHFLDHIQLSVAAELDGNVIFTENITDVSDNIFFSMLVPNDLSLVLKLLVKHDLSNDHSSTISHHSSVPPITLGKMNLPIHSFVPFHSPSPAYQGIQRQFSQELTFKNPLSLPPSSFPIAMVIDIPIAPPDMDLIAKLSIYRLENLPLNSNSTLPNAYCVVYIVGRDGKIIESVGNKTVPIKSCHPVWNIEFMLHTHLGISEIESILIKVKDASVGTFRHKHIGQIELPIDVFLPTHPPAQLKLPLMATERMKNEVFDVVHHETLGEMMVGTQLIKIPKVTIAPQKQRSSITGLFLSVDQNTQHSQSQLPTPEIKNISQSSTFMKSPKLALMSMSVDDNDDHFHSEPAPEGGVVKFKCELRHICPSTIWFPCLGLCSDELAPTLDEYGSRWDDKECLFSIDEFAIRTRKNYDHPDINEGEESHLPSVGENEDEFILIPWIQVCDVTKLSDSSLSVTFTTTSTFDPKNIVETNRKSFFSSPVEVTESQHGDILVEVLVAPCPAAALVELYKDRIQSFQIREDLIRLVKSTSPLLSNSIERRQFRPALNVVRLSISLLNRCLEVISIEAIATKELNEQLRIIQETSRTAVTVDPSLRRPSLRTLSRNTLNLHSSIVIRMRLYVALLIQQCRSVREKQFPTLTYLQFDDEMSREFKDDSCSRDAYETRRNEWMHTIEEWSSYDAEIKVQTPEIISIIDSIIFSCIQQVRIIILCGSPVGESDKDLLIDNLETALTDHFTIISNVVKLFLRSEFDFQKIVGQKNQTNFIKYLILHDHQFSNMLLPSLSLIGCHYDDPPMILGENGLRDLVKLYSKGLIYETRLWLSKTITQSKTCKENELLPWDLITVSGGLIVSTLPETLRFQMNQYTLLLSRDSMHLLSSSGSTHYTQINEDVTGPFLTGYTRANYTLREIEQMEEETFQMVGLHEQILRAICKSFCLMAQEYLLVLHSKHWEIIDPTPSPEGTSVSPSLSEIDHLHFLISICNDCFRINTQHLPELLRIESSTDWSENTKQLIKKVNVDFQEVSDYAMKCITRLIFRDLQDIMINFERLWLKMDSKSQFIKLLPSKLKNTDVQISPIQVIMTTIEDYLSDIKDHMESSIYFELIASCVEICSMRYLLFLKELSNHKKVLDGDNVTHLQMDVIALIDGFKVHSEFELHHYLNPISRCLSIIADVVALITSSDTTDPTFTLTLQRLCHQKKYYTDEEKIIIKDAMDCLLSLRLDCRGDYGAGHNKREELIHNAILPLPSDSPLLKMTSQMDTILLKAFYKKSDHTTKLFQKILPTTVASTVGSDGTITKGLKFISSGVGTRGRSYKESNHVELQRNLGLIDRERARSRDYTEEFKSSRNLQSQTGPSFNEDSDEESPTFLSNNPQLRGKSSHEYSIQITNIRARNLTTKALFGEANPYVVITYGNIRQKLPVQWNTNHPAWEKEEIVIPHISMSQINKKLDIKIYDKERIARKTLLGAVLIPIDGVDLHPIESWFALSGGMIGCNGEIYVNIRRVH